MTDVVLRARGLRKAFGGQTVLGGVDVTLHRGQVVLLEGENGSGKTTLLNILTGCLPPDSGSVEYIGNGRPRRFEFPQRWRERANPFRALSPETAAAGGIGRTWQEVRLFGTQSLRDNVVLAVPNHPGENPLLSLAGASRVRAFEQAAQDEVDETLSRFGLSDRATSSGDRVSLGQAKRVAIARAVHAGGQVLCLDEPLAGLDAAGVSEVVALLEHLVQTRAITLVIVEHVLNQPFLKPLVQTQWELVDGRLRDGKPDATAPRLEQLDYWRQALGLEHSRVDTLSRGGVLLRTSEPLHQAADDRTGLTIQGLVVQRGLRPVLGFDNQQTPGLDLEIPAGETAVLLAPNGWGKTTLCRAIVGEQRYTSGTVRAAREGLYHFSADATLFPRLTCAEFLELGGWTRSEARTTMNGLAHRPLGSLSGGERKRLQLKLLERVPDGAVVIMDEPLASLDLQHIQELLTTIRARRGRLTFLLLVPKHV